MRSRQQGMTAIGALIIAVLVGIVGLGALKLTPIYLEQMKILSVLEDVKGELDGQNASVALIRSAIGKRLNIEMISVLKKQDFVIKKSEMGYSVRVQYDNEAPFIGDVYLLARFNDSVEIRR
ncbi:MAG: DUF4845 domain-containing protein [Gammaproteobacteria bacterium]